MRNAAFFPAIILALAAFTGPLTAQDQTPGAVYGRVVDRQSGDAVVAADLWLEGTNLHRVSDSDGRFDFGEVTAGAYLLRVRHLGYREIADTLKVGAGKYLDMDVQMVPEAIQLAPLVVVAEYDASGKMSGFYERKRFSQGSFITRADVDRERPGKVSDILRHVRGMHVVPSRSPTGLDMGFHVLMRGNCRPTVYIDGAATMSLAMSLDQMVQPAEIQGIEVYRGPETPPQFQRNTCGAILIWTRPGDTHGDIPFWKGLIIIGGGLAVLFFLFKVF